MIRQKLSNPGFRRFLFGATTLLIASLSCNFGQPEPLYIPENPTQYTAEVQTDYDVYVVVDESGNVVDFGGTYAYGADATMRYVLRFWDVGNRLDGYGEAAIYRVYSPTRITGINQDLEADMSEAQKADIYVRSVFPATEVKWAEITFSGGPEGNFAGNILETGEDILGYMDWREKDWEMHVCFYYDVSKSGCVQDFLVLGDEPFYNWP